MPVNVGWKCDRDLNASYTLMFNQFRVLYPKGSLITELVTIEGGKYVVRSLIQVEGVTLTTGLAAADTVEVAEDQARSRALSLLGIYPVNVAEEKETHNFTPELPMPLSHQKEFSQDSLGQAHQSPASPEISKVEPPSLSFLDSKLTDASLDTTSFPSEQNSIPFADDFSPSEKNISTEEDIYDFETPAVIQSLMPQSQLNLSSASVKPLPDYEPEAKALETPPTTEAIDFSDIVARTNIEIKRLGWSTEQGRDYLMQTYNKRARSLLTDRELLDFLGYLESQPRPND
ncbi:MAG: hypothetical protein NVS2B14_08640 [Chamaesiphon sp.]